MMLSENALNEYNELMRKLRELSEDDRREFFLIMLASCAAALRGSDGIEFVNGYLQAAMNDNGLSIYPNVDG